MKEVRLLMEHEWVSDVNITLISPSGTEVLLLSNVGGNGDNLGDPTLPSCFGAMVLSDDACDAFSSGTAPFADKPTALQPLYLFNDGTTSANGNWELRIAMIC
ncbi:MAG: proprotein convertase P-domain-containing protein [Saprospiraceae bacterium]